MNNHRRQIILINLIERGPIIEDTVELEGVRFQITQHAIGWDYDTAEKLIAQYDGFADAIALSGVQRHLGAGSFKTSHPGYLRLLRAATRTQVYISDDIRDFFAEWTLNRVLKRDPELFRGKKVLFHSALASPILDRVHKAGAQVYSADASFASCLNLRLKGVRQMELFGRAASKLQKFVVFNMVRPLASSKQIQQQAILNNWIRDCDIFVGFASMMNSLADFEVFRGKLVIVDSLSSDLKDRLENAGAISLIELIPGLDNEHIFKTRYFSVLAAMLDQARQIHNSDLDFQEYVFDWYQRMGVSPKKRMTSRSLPRKCGFLIHPLDQNYLWMAKHAGFMKNAPSLIKDAAETAAARLPIFYWGSLKGVRSVENDQEVQCDFYALAATPKQILAMDQETLYRKLLQGVEMARENGASIVGLGAYTKVAGDAGLTVSRRASIPVTNGNSYSASTTLWAAREMVEKMGLISTERIGNRFNAKVTIVGATGSIGRVSSLLVSLVFQNVVLVANRADRLFELREEILALSPGINVRITTRPEADLADSDLIVTATSNHHGSTIDMRAVKPGAVVADCSRPVDIGPKLALSRPDVLVLESGEVLMPGDLKLNCDLGIPSPSIYACTAETILLALEGRMESFSTGKQLSMAKVKEIYKLGVKHGAALSAIRGPLGFITDDVIDKTRALAIERLKTWNPQKPKPPADLKPPRSSVSIPSNETSPLILAAT
jgi:predicted amino acid dehydrogenase